MTTQGKIVSVVNPYETDQVASAQIAKSFRLIPLIEISVFFSLCHLIDLIFLPHTQGFNHLIPHPYWLAIIFFSAKYGAVEGVVTAFVASGFYLFYQKTAVSTGNPLLFTYNYLQYPVSFHIIALFLGKILDNLRKKTQQQKVEIENLQKDFDLLATNYQLLKKSKEEIEKRIVGQEATVNTMYTGIKRLNNLTEPKIYPAILDLMEEFLQVKQGSVYMMQGKKLLLKASRNWAKEQSYKEEYTSDDPLFYDTIIKQKSLSVNRWEDYQKMESDRTLAVVPIIDELSQQAFGMLKIEDIEFVNLNNSTVQFLQVLADWSASAILNAIEKDKGVEHSLIDKLSEIYCNTYFQISIKREFAMATRHELPLSVIRLVIIDFKKMNKETQKMVLKVTGTMLKQKFRSNDVIGKGQQEDSILVLLPMTPESGAQRCIRLIQERVDQMDFSPLSDKNRLSFNFTCYSLEKGNLTEEIIADL